ncbi:MAG: hypothetical protein JSW25_05905 [Thermoplasmata archaeon]|nr:MAG: hypothetical protein JSW25_05905 [Thermoplasmata archaeon]
MSVWLPDTEDHVHTLDQDSDTMRLTVVLPSYYMYLPDKHHHLHFTSTDEAVISVPPFEVTDLTFDWELPVEVHGGGEAILHLEGQVFFCPVADATICIYATIDSRYHVRVERGAGHRLEIVHDVTILDTLDQTGVSHLPPVEAGDEN